MDTSEDAHDYDNMDHSTVNRVFVDDFLAFAHANGFADRLADQRRPPRLLDVGTGTAQIPIELCRRRVACQIVAIDLADEMLKLAALNIAQAGFANVIQVARIDAKQMPNATSSFEAVISNSIVHHIPRPTEVFAEMVRVLCGGGLLFVRDLLRPDSLVEVDRLVVTYAGKENVHSQQLFRDSLQAALSLREIQDLAIAHGIPARAVSQTTDRHWTLAWRSE
jgi:ubiquinone/menaquinone biosynthesis C-methylase UbiE